jgi:hypothetical protein
LGKFINSSIRTPAITKTINSLANAFAVGSPVYNVYNGTTTSVVAQLSTADLIKARASYNSNPNVFKGQDTNVLKAMGLNPNLSNGSITGNFYNSNVANPPPEAPPPTPAPTTGSNPNPNPATATVTRRVGLYYTPEARAARATAQATARATAQARAAATAQATTQARAAAVIAAVRGDAALGGVATAATARATAQARAAAMAQARAAAPHINRRNTPPEIPQPYPAPTTGGVAAAATARATAQARATEIATATATARARAVVAAQARATARAQARATARTASTTGGIVG